jgi:hypothetical protein
MRWGYKTVQYGLKKEGLLGSSFLDEAEVEQSLNEFGQGGWELVSLFGMHDGLMAVFKQPLEVESEPVHEPSLKENPPVSRFSLNSREGRDPDPGIDGRVERKQPGAPIVIQQKNEEEEGVGSIRIE